jgi:hypothetical protein
MKKPAKKAMKSMPSKGAAGGGKSMTGKVSMKDGGGADDKQRQMYKGKK